jgi:uncharacterized protein YcgI (DUF1989 family)
VVRRRTAACARLYICYIKSHLVELYETQLAFLDQIVAEGDHGASREEALKTLLAAHVADRRNGAEAYVGGGVVRDVLETPFPDYGEPRLDITLEPVTGKAVPVYRGEVLRIEQIEGGTCVDFNAFNLDDYKETMDCGFTRSFQSFDPSRGEFIWTAAPRGRPMYQILELADTCELDIVGHRCNRPFQELGWGETAHANCQDSLAEAIREYGLTPDDVQDSFNLWMATTIDDDGDRQFRWNPARKGDRIDLLAMFDTLSASVICGLGDLVGINNFTFTNIRLQVFEKSAATEALVDEANARWGQMESQVKTEDLKAVPVPSDRALKRDESYEPNYRPAPARTNLEVELSEPELELVEGLRSEGLYGDTEGEVVRAAFMRWCNTHRTRIRRPLVKFTTPSHAESHPAAP